MVSCCWLSVVNLVQELLLLNIFRSQTMMRIEKLYFWHKCIYSWIGFFKLFNSIAFIKAIQTIIPPFFSISLFIFCFQHPSLSTVLDFSFTIFVCWKHCFSLGLKSFEVWPIRSGMKWKPHFETKAKKFRLLEPIKEFLALTMFI